MKFEIRKVVSVQDFNKLVEETYGKPYNFQQQADCKERGTVYVSTDDIYDYENDTIPEIVNHPDMGVSFKAWLERDPNQPLLDREDKWGIELWWSRNFYPDVSMIIDDLNKRGLLEEKSFYIEIDW